MRRKRWIENNPLAGVEGIGKRKYGKAQFRIDEARMWIAVAVKHASRGESGAVAAMMTLLMGLRASEVTSRVVRDVDDEGRLLWIPDAKTEAGKRTQQVPDMLRPYLVELAKGRETGELLLGHHWHRGHRCVRP